MPNFATRADLLERSSARRLAQLAVPTDMRMPPDEALRLAIGGGVGVLDAFTADEVVSTNLAVAAIDKALTDASALMVSYGLPDAASNSLLARLCSTIALYYLQGAERMTEDVQRTYDASVATLKSHSKGELALIPVAPQVPPISEATVQFDAPVRRYGGAPATSNIW
jgi:phage gp36-like protein